MILTRILEHAEERAGQLKEIPPIERYQENLSLKMAIQTVTDRNAVIAELKYASPSRGSIRKGPPPEILAQELIDGGCAALSVLTEPHFFGGDCDYIRRVKAISRVPVLRKDFIIDVRQLYETKTLNADAVLLIAAILRDRLPAFVDLSRNLGLEPLVETHNEQEVILALSTDAELIGINNRDLKMMKIDLRTTKRLSRLIDREDRVVVSESGVVWPYDIRHLNPYCDAFLIGSSIMASQNPRKRLEGFVYA
jgi:indole-3-glycerol phosphate synthase